jgi:hypothetical protein
MTTGFFEFARILEPGPVEIADAACLLRGMAM